MKKIKFYGIGGQGAVTASKILSKAVSLYQNEYAITVPAYGHERRGAPVFAHIIVDDEPVLLNCYVYEPDIVVVFDEHIIDMGINVGEGCTEETILVINSIDQNYIDRYRMEFGFKKIYACDAVDAALKNIGLTIPNSAMLGALAKTGIVKIDAIINAVTDSFGKVGEKNGDAARYAYEHTREA